MEKPIKPLWWLQQRVQRRAKAYGRGLIAGAVRQPEVVYWDPECLGLGRSEWVCGYIRLKRTMPAPELMARLNRSIARLQAKYDLGIVEA